MNPGSPYPLPVAWQRTQGILSPLCESFKVPKLLTLTFLFCVVYQCVHHSKKKQADYSGYTTLL